MIYTVGNQEVYDEQLNGPNHDKFEKVGRNGSYPGGFAVRTVSDAQRLIAEWGHVGTWAIYEVDARWGEDTTPSLQGWWHALLYDRVITRKVEVKTEELVVRHEVAEAMQKLLEEPEPTWTKDIPFDREVTFDDGIRMVIQVCPSGRDPTIAEGVDGEPHWTQGVLFGEEGTELGCTEPGDEFLGEYIIEGTRVGEKVRIVYTVVVKEETPYPEEWEVTGQPVHDLIIVGPMEQRDQVSDWVHKRGGWTTRSGPTSTGNFPQYDQKRFEVHAKIPIGNAEIEYQKLECIVCGGDFVRPQAPGGFSEATGQGVCSGACRRELAESGVV